MHPVRLKPGNSQSKVTAPHHRCLHSGSFDCYSNCSKILNPSQLGYKNVQTNSADPDQTLKSNILPCSHSTYTELFAHSGSVDCYSKCSKILNTSQLVYKNGPDKQCRPRSDSKVKHSTTEPLHLHRDVCIVDL